MSKQKKKKLFSKQILTIAGLFTAGSVVGASVDFDSLLELNYTIPSLRISDVEKNTISEGVNETSEGVNETEQDIITPIVQGTVIPEMPISDTLLSEPEEEQLIPEPAVIDPPIIAESPSPLPENESSALPEPESSPVPSEDWRNDDWMEAIFVPTVPTEQPESVSTPASDWMEKNEEPILSNTVPSTVSSMTSELAGMLEGIAVFWASSGGKIHLNPSCRSFDENTVRYAGTLEEAQTLCTGGWCKLCADHFTGTENSEFYIEGNIYSTKEILLDSYTYNDYCSGIPVN